jgi:hypothetical protein
VELRDGVMVDPGYFEPVCKFLHGLGAAWQPDNDSCGGCTYPGNHPEKIFHGILPFRVADFGWMQRNVFAFAWGTDFRAAGGSDYTLGMDSVRFGRVLGIGTRLAAKTLVEAVDAAMAPNPSAKPETPAAPPSRAEVAGTQAAQQVRRTASQAKVTGAGLKEGGRRFGQTMWEPFVRLSGVLWLELTGVFFGIFAVFGATSIWKQRGDLHLASTNHDTYLHFLLLGGMTLVFGYFFVSSFVKAHLRGKKRPR